MRLAALIPTVLAPPAVGCTALAVTEAFTGTNGAQIETLPGWALNTAGSLDIQTNSLAPDAFGADQGARRTGASFYADQYAQAIVVALGGGDTRWIGVACRMATDGSANYYGFYTNATTCAVFKILDGTPEFLSEELPAPTVAQVMRLEVTGTTIRALLAEVEVFSGTDGSLVAGAPGVCGFGDITTNRIDDWEGGNICS